MWVPQHKYMEEPNDYISVNREPFLKEREGIELEP